MDLFKSHLRAISSLDPNLIAIPLALRYKASMQCRPHTWCRWTQHSGKGRSGFSLLEVLIVLALILVLTALYWGSTTGGQQRSQMAGCQKNLQKVFVAMEIYAHEHGDKFPVVTTARTSEEALDPLVPRYTADTSIFICPASHNLSLSSGESLMKRRISYAYYMGHAASDSQQVLISDRQVDTQSKPTGQEVFSSSAK